MGRTCVFALLLLDKSGRGYTNPAKDEITGDRMQIGVIRIRAHPLTLAVGSFNPRILFSSSCHINLALRASPPPKNPNDPSLFITLWQGIKSGKGLLAMVVPTNREALGRPMDLAISP